MRKVKYFPKPVGVPKKSPFFTGVLFGLLFCVPFWMMVIHFFF